MDMSVLGNLLSSMNKDGFDLNSLNNLNNFNATNNNPIDNNATTNKILHHIRKKVVRIKNQTL